MSQIRKRMMEHRQDLLKRRQETEERQISGRSIFLKNKFTEGMKVWMPESNEVHLIDVIPFFAGSQHPHIKKGEIAYSCDLYIHKRIGILNDNYVCPLKNFSKECPICEYIKEKRPQGDDYTAIRTFRREVYFVWVHDEKGVLEKLGPIPWDVPYFFFEQKINEIAKLPRGGGYINYVDPDNGKSIRFKISSKSKENMEYLGHAFVDRRGPIPDDILDLITPLDELIDMHPSYEAIKNSLYGKKAEKDDIDDSKFDVPTSLKKCPAGEEFGVAPEQFPECDACVEYEACNTAYEIRTKKEEPEPEPEPKRKRFSEPEPKKEEEPTRDRMRRRMV